LIDPGLFTGTLGPPRPRHKVQDIPMGDPNDIRPGGCGSDFFR